MNTLLKKSKLTKIILTIFFALTILSTSFIGYNFKPNFMPQVYASHKQDVSSTISNSDFSSTDSATIPSPRNWTYNNYTNSDNTIANGVINVYPDQFDDKMTIYHLEENPGTTEPGKTYAQSSEFYKHLMINGYVGSSRANFTSSEFTLQKSSYYAITVIAKTIDNAMATVNLTGLSDKGVEAGIVNFNTFGEWEEYQIFIATNNFNDEKVKLELWLGGTADYDTTTGAVFFNKVSLVRYSQSTFSLEVYYADLYQSGNKTFVVAELSGEVNDSNFCINPNFEYSNIAGDFNEIAGFETISTDVIEDGSLIRKIVNVNSGFTEEILQNNSIVNPLNNGTANNNSVLFLYNNSTSYQGVESSDILIEKHLFYKLSVWAKSSCNTGKGGTIKLIEKDTNENVFEPDTFTPVTETITVPNQTSSTAPTNNWVQYSFYIEGNALKNTFVNLQLWLGLKDNASNGYVFYDNITLQKISYQNYLTGTSATNSKKYSLNNITSNSMVENGNFDLSLNESTELVYPLTARNWAQSTPDISVNVDKIVSGIVNTLDDDFDKLIEKIETLGGYVSNPQLTPLLKTPYNSTADTQNNVLMIGNLEDTTQSFTSDNISLSAKTFYKITFYLNSQFTPHTDNIGASIKLNSTEYSVFELKNIDTSGNWAAYTVYLYTNTSLTTNIELGLNTYGFAFFDDINISTTTENIFYSAQRNLTPSDNIFVINLNQETFDLFTSKSVEPVNNSFNWTGISNTESTLTTFGILNSKTDVNELINGFDPQPVNGNNVLVIYSPEDTYYTASTINSYELQSGKNYKITVKVKTRNIIQEESNKVLDENDIAIEPGVSISLSNYEEKFTGINNNKFTNENKWVDYVFYVSPETTISTKMQISLGYENALTSGAVYVDSIMFEELEQADYTEEVEAISSSDTKLCLTALLTNEDNEDETEPTFSGNNFDWLLVSTLLISVATIIAMTGVIVRKINFKGKPKVKTSYDRRKTLNVVANKREKVELRQSVIEELKQELVSIDEETSAYLKFLDEEVNKVNQKDDERKQRISSDKQQLVSQILSLKEEYNNLSEQEKINRQIQYGKQIKKLEAKIVNTEKEEQKTPRNIRRLNEEREQFIQKQDERKGLINSEINKVNNEIKKLSENDDDTWSEYRQAKEEAKKQKREKNLNKSGNNKVEIKENTDVKSDDVIEVIDEDSDKK